MAVPSLRKRYGPGQLPVKLIDGMMAGRAVIASDLAPLKWALGGTGLIVRSGSVGSLVNGLLELEDLRTREALGREARLRALGTFVPAVIAPVLRSACEQAACSVFDPFEL